MIAIVAVLAVCVLVPSAHGANTDTEWCYHLTSCNDTTWPKLFPNFCDGARQSPIDIISASAVENTNLTAFTFTNYDSISTMTKIENTGHTVKVTLASGVTVSGGDLSETYDSLQFHLHWGNGASVPGSEHTVNGKRYPMELHIVNSKSSLNRNTTLAVADSTGLAALGFFIEERSGDETDQPASWNNLSSYLSRITNRSDSAMIAPGFSLDDLLSGVDRTSYYRYLGSLTTPTCNEAVVWTVFKDTIKVSKELINLFSTTVHVTNSSSPLLVNVFRNVQAPQQVTTTLARSDDSVSASSGATSTKSYSLGLMALGLALVGRS